MGREKGPFGAETPSQPAQETCSGQGDIPDLACLLRGRKSPGQGWPLHRALKVQLLQHFLTSTSQKQTNGSGEYSSFSMRGKIRDCWS